jgi:hypothetical protein
VILITSVLPLVGKSLHPATNSKLHRFYDLPKTRKTGEVVTKEELLEALWPDVMVVDGSLATAVSNLRNRVFDNCVWVQVTGNAGSGSFVALYCAVELREITWTVSILAKSVVSASVVPSAK